MSKPSNSVRTVASVHSYAKSLAVHGGFVYWADAYLDKEAKQASIGRIGRVERAGGTVTALSEAPGLTGSLMVGNDALVWIAPEEIRAMNFDGTQPRLLATARYPVALALHDERVYFTDSKAGSIHCVPLSGGPVSTIATGLHRPDSIAVDKSHVMFSEWPDDAPHTGKVSRIPVGGGSVTVLAHGQDRPTRLTIDGSSLYWGHYPKEGISEVRKMPLQGGEFTTVVPAPVAQTVDYCIAREHLYWTWSGTRGMSNGVVGRTARSGGEPEVLVERRQWPSLITVDDTGIYWLNLDPGEIQTLPLAR